MRVRVGEMSNDREKRTQISFGQYFILNIGSSVEALNFAFFFKLSMQNSLEQSNFLACLFFQSQCPSTKVFLE